MRMRTAQHDQACKPTDGAQYLQNPQYLSLPGGFGRFVGFVGPVLHSTGRLASMGGRNQAFRVGSDQRRRTSGTTTLSRRRRTIAPRYPNYPNAQASVRASRIGHQ